MNKQWKPALLALVFSCLMLMTLALAPAKEVRAEGEVESIEFERADPYVAWLENSFYLADDGTYHCNSYNTTLFNGDKLTVNSASGSKAYAFSMDDNCFIAEDGETISRSDVDVNMRDYIGDWALDGAANYYSVSYGGASCLVPIEVKTSPVASIEYIPVDRYEMYYDGGFFMYKDNDKVIVHYKDGTTEEFLYDSNTPYPYEPAYNVKEGDWSYSFYSFVSQTDGHLVPSQHPFKYFESMRVDFDDDTRVYTMSYMGAKAYANDSVFVLAGISYEQASPYKFSQKNDAVTVERDDGTTYEYYDLEARFVEGDILHARYETINQTERIIDYVCDSWGYFHLSDNYVWSLYVTFPDQAESPLQPNTTYEFPVYVTDAYSGYEGNYYFESDKGYKVTIVGKPDTTIENTRSESPDIETWLQILADAGFTDGYFSSDEATAEDVYRLVTAYYYYDKEPGYTVTLDYEDFRSAAVQVIDGYYNVDNWEFQASDRYDEDADTVTLTVDPADPEIHFEMRGNADPDSGSMVVNRVDRSGNQQGMARLTYGSKLYQDEYCLVDIKPFNANYTIEDTRSEAPDFETWLQILANAGLTDGYYYYFKATADDIYRMVTAYYYYDKEPGYTVTLDYEDFTLAAGNVIYYDSWDLDLRESDRYDPENGTVTLTVDPVDAEIHFEATEYVNPEYGALLVNRIGRTGDLQGMAVLKYSYYESEYCLWELRPYEDAEYEVRWSYYLPYQYDYPHKEGLPQVIYENAWLFVEYDYYKNGEKTESTFSEWQPYSYNLDPEGIVGFEFGFGGTPSMRGLSAGTAKLSANFWFAWTKDIIMNGPENNPTCTTEATIKVRPQTMKLDRDEMILAVGESEMLGVSGLEEENDSLMETSFNVGYWGTSDTISVDPTGKVTGLAPGVENYLTVISEKGQAQQIHAYVYDIQLSENEFTADGSPKEPAVVSILGPYVNSYGYSEYSPDDWSVVGYENNVRAGTATVVIELRNTGIADAITIRKSFTILPGATVPVTGISLDKTSLTLGMGLSETLTAVVDPADASDASVIWTSSDESIVTVDQTGKITAGMNYGKAIVTAETVDGGFTASCEVDVRFRDVMDTKLYYYKPVYWAAENGITKGYTTGEYAGKFGVSLDCQRKDLMIFLWRFAGQPTKDKNGNPYGDARTLFNDMSAYKPSSAANKAVAWAAKEGISKGYSDGGFHPTDSIVRKDVMIMLYRLAGKPAVSGTLTFTDCQDLNKKSDTYKAILWGSKNKITNGYSSGEYAGQFGINLSCLREQIVTFLYRYHNLK